MASVLSRWASPELRASIFHFTVYLPGAVSSVYLAIWLAEHGIPAEQIGIINALPVLLLLGINMLVGRLADRASDWRSTILIVSLLSGAAPIGLFFVHEFWGIVLVWLLCTIPGGLVPPLTDAATLRLAQRTGSDFGSMRAWGTIGYVIGTALVGLAVTAYGTAAFVPLFFAVSVGRAIIGFTLPRFRAPAPVSTLADANPEKPRLSSALKLWFVLPILGFALVNSNNAVVGGFGALIWHDNGIPDYFIGPLLAIAAAAEAVLMVMWRRFGGRVTARNMILVACAASLLRFFVMAFNPPVAVLFVTQTLHAFSFGMGYFGVVHFIANWTSEDIAAEAQGFATMLQQGAAFVSLMLFGVLVGHFGAGAFFASALFALLGMGCVLWSLKLKPPKDA
ncbi:putative 3-phenylpropionic acid transporter [Devosia sp. LC5]|uniref:MFS transporter n=1 Tax=Devosia sp. LC5 TaxID=1502724 RepID=UPI0004E3AF21|nr:MFS transporter [Devosia sp. LC5]KFC66292.1 putative 3-phenylpropionic acid transporter [Devosia sp. LC5]